MYWLILQSIALSTSKVIPDITSLLILISSCQSLMGATVTFVVMGSFIGISQSAGIGGGPILNICLMMGLGFGPKTAMALTYIFLMGGSLAAMIQNHHKKRKNGYPVVDYELLELTLPLTLAGAIFGVMLNHYMSEIMITVLFSLLLTYLSYSCYRKYKQSLKTEDQDESPSAILLPQWTPGSQQPLEATSHPILQSILESQRSPFPREKIKVILYVVSTTIIMLLLRGSTNFPSLLGIQPCGIMYWVLNFLYLALCYLFTKSSAIRIFKIQQEKSKFGLQQPPQQKMTAAKFRSSMFYGFLAGITGGALGLGGAIILVPVWLNNKVDKDVATSTSPPIIFLSTLIPAFISAISGKYYLFQCISYFALAFFSSLFIKWIVGYLAVKYGLKSIVYILLVFTMAVSLLALVPFEYYKYTQDPIGFVETGSFC